MVRVPLLCEQWSTAREGLPTATSPSPCYNRRLNGFRLFDFSTFRLVTTALLIDDRFKDHKTGPGHPERPERLDAIRSAL